MAARAAPTPSAGQEPPRHRFRHWLLVIVLFVVVSVAMAGVMLALRECGSYTRPRINPYGSSEPATR